MASLASSLGFYPGAHLVPAHQVSHPRSIDYSWSDVHLAPFRVHGFLALRAPDRSPRYNIEHFVDRRRRMDWQRSYSPTVESLSLNILLIYTSLGLGKSSIELYRPARGRGISLVQAFVQDCLCSMPREGGHIPLESLDTWWAEHGSV